MIAGAEIKGGPPIGVLIVDDHDLFRAGLVAMLKQEPGIEVLAQASRGRLGVQLARELHPRVAFDGPPDARPGRSRGHA